jgi:hypothetical protein
MGTVITYQRGPWDCRAVVQGAEVWYECRLAGFWFPMKEHAAPPALRSAAACEISSHRPGSCEHCPADGGGCIVCQG